MATPYELVKVQDTFDEFLTNKKDGVLVAILGVMNHWVAIAIHKEKGICKEYLLDSLGHKYLDESDDKIPENAFKFVFFLI